MSTPKTRFCDCCGKEIPYKENNIHMPYDNYVANCLSYNEGNEKVYGLVVFNMHKSHTEDTVTPNEGWTDGSRCRDICPECKIKFLEHVIEALKRFS